MLIYPAVSPRGGIDKVPLAVVPGFYSPKIKAGRTRDILQEGHPLADARGDTVR
jgi:hypothetical protein